MGWAGLGWAELSCAKLGRDDLPGQHDLLRLPGLPALPGWLAGPERTSRRWQICDKQFGIATTPGQQGHQIELRRNTHITATSTLADLK
jgi:hypothetical protein